VLEIITKAWDDKIHAERGEKVEAQGTHALEWDGVRVLLDLTDPSFKAIDALIRPLLVIGRKDDTPGAPKPAKSAKARKDGQPSVARARKPSAYYDGMRAFADASNGEHRYTLDSEGKATYPPKLRAAFEQTDAYRAMAAEWGQ
jgi:hypothetical protein